jgi:hypothetical protein
MSNNKTKYLIFPNEVYILEYDNFKAEVKGSEILTTMLERYQDYTISNDGEGSGE